MSRLPVHNQPRLKDICDELINNILTTKPLSVILIIKMQNFHSKCNKCVSIINMFSAGTRLQTSLEELTTRPRLALRHWCIRAGTVRNAISLIVLVPERCSSKSLVKIAYGRLVEIILIIMGT